MGKKILIVDDDLQNLRFLELALTHTGYTVTSANNGQQAFELFNRLNPDLVITDMFMPRMNGIQLLKEIRKINQKIPVIGFTGAHFEHGDEEMDDLGFTTVLKKPVDTGHLKETIAKLLDNKK